SFFAERACQLVELPRHAKVLDVGSGPGTLSLLISSRADEVHALDISVEMLQLLQVRAMRDGLKNVHTHHGDGQKLPFPNDIFDAACSMFAIMFFEHPERGLRELFRVMKPGACVLVGTWMVERSTLMEVGFELAREVLDLPNPTGDSDV